MLRAVSWHADCQSRSTRYLSMEWWDVIRLSVADFVAQHGVMAGFVLILIEEAGLPVPVAGDFLMLGLGVHAREGRVPLWQALAVMEMATLIGASVLYVL